MKSAKKESEKLKSREPIALVGIGCRFPGSIYGPSQFWQGLKKGIDAITDVPANRWSVNAFYDPDPDKAGKIKTKKGGFLDEIDKFDAEFFGIYPKTAERIDPQQRLLLEVTYEAFEDAGIKPEDISGSKTAVYVGVFTNDYWDIQAASEQKDHLSPHVSMGVILTAIANRLSYTFNLKGPSVTIDTACSSSLVAVHMACQSIWTGESKQAIAGGVNMILRPETSIMMSKGNFLSPDGYCKSFDSRANGYVRSEGCGIVILKPLSQAIADGDQIYGTILGTAVNQDGYTESGFTVPSLSSQTDMLENAYANAGVNPASVAYVEAHGTGTPVGDPIETNAFGNVIGKGRKEGNECIIGSVKTNVGHLEAAAGIAGLIKLSLILKHKQIPKNLHFLKPNPNIPFADYKLKVSTELQELPENGQPAIVGVNSFGAGGTNAHVVMQGYRPAAEVSRHNGQAQNSVIQLFAVTARSSKALKEHVKNYIDFIEKSGDSLEDICFSSMCRRSWHPYRLAMAVKTKEDLIGKLNAFLRDEERPGMHTGQINLSKNHKIGFIFSGQGPQWFAMGQQLMHTSSLFRQIILKIDTLFSKMADWSLLEEMHKDETNSRIGETNIAQPAIMAIQIALAELWKSRGVIPAGCVGHSIGEVAAAYTAGALSLEQAVEVIYHRSRGQNKASDKGKMLAVGLPYNKAKDLINGHTEIVSVAAINGPNIVTLSGDAEPLESIAEDLDHRDIFHRFLRVNVPFHSHHMESLKDELIASLQHLQPTEAKVPLYSTVTGKQEDGKHLNSDYWYKNVREPVFFTDALQSMINDGYNTFIEIAPHPVLTNGALELLKENKIHNPVIVPSLRRGEDEDIVSMGSLAALFTRNFTVKTDHLFSKEAKFVKLPAYPWQHRSYWFETKTHQRKRLGEDNHPFLPENTQMISDPGQILWSLPLSAGAHPYLKDHQVDGAMVFPGTGHLEAATAAGRSSFPESFSHVENIVFDKALFIPDEDAASETKLEISSHDHRFRIFSKQDTEGSNWIMNAEGKMVFENESPGIKQLDIDKIKSEVSNPVSVSGFYLEIKQNGLHYGETFRGVQKLWSSDMSLLGEVALHENLQYGIDKYHFHPALLDSCLHILEYAAHWATDGDQAGIYLPAFLQKYKIYQQVPEKVWCYVKVKEASPDTLRADYAILDAKGMVIAELQGLECTYIEGSRGERNIGVYDGFYDYIWHENVGQPDPPDESITAPPLIFLSQGELGKKIVARFRDSNQSALWVTKAKDFKKVDDCHYEINPDSPEDLDRLFLEVNQNNKVEKIAYLWPMDTQFNPYLSDTQLENQQKSLTGAMLCFLQAVIRSENEPALTVVVQATEKVLPNDKVNVNQSAVYGLGRVMLNEYPFTKVSIIDLSEFPDDQEIGNLYNHLVAKGGGDINFSEIALRNDRQYTRKLIAVDQGYVENQAQKEINARNTAFVLETSSNKSLADVFFRKISRPVLRDHELEVSVLAAGVNDTQLTDQSGFLLTGNEFAGVVTKTGKNVKRLKEGDEVMVFGKNVIGGVIRAREDLVIPKPAGWSFADAVKLYKPLFSALYGLKYLGELKKDDFVFIRSPLSITALAAIEVARNLGIKAITIGQQYQDESFQKLMEPVLFVNPHEDNPAEKLLALTHGKGIKLVITNGDVPEMVRKNLRPFARIVDLNPEADQISNIELSVPGELNISFHHISLDTILQHKPEICKDLLDTVGQWSLHEDQLSKAVPVHPVHQFTKFPGESAPGSRQMKRVITMDRSIISLSPPTELTVEANATYLITGGASGFGLILAKWLADNSARHLALLSRSGCKYDRDYEIVDAMQANGVNVHLMKTDVANQKEIQLTLNIIRESMPPLKGIIHSAAVLDDATIPNTDIKQFMRVFNPKVKGAWNLHMGTQGDELDFFIMLSSVSSVIGWPGQANYSSANNFLDKLALYRQSQGMVGSSINLGVLDDYAGMTKSGEGGNLIKVLFNQGWIPLTLKEVTEKIGTIMMQNPVQRMAANLDWLRFKDSFPHLSKDSRFSDIINEILLKNEGQQDKGSLIDKIKGADNEEKESLLINNIVASLAKILGVSTEKVTVDKPITGMGLDSLMLNQLRNWIQQTLGLNYPLMRIAKGPSIHQLAGQLLTDLTSENKQGKNADNNGNGKMEAPEGIEYVGKWFMKSRHKDGDEINFRIFCIHPVGAGASMFGHFLYNPPANTEVLAYQLPGRENRSEEAPFERVETLVPEMATAMKPFLDKPFIVLGHSFGGIIGFELIHFIKERYGVQPQHLFVTGTCAPHLTQAWKKTETITETAVAANSTEKLLGLLNYIEDVDFLKSILPVMKRDMPLIMSYPYQDKGLLDFPVTAFAADKDDVVTIKEVASWKAQTNHAFELEMVEGDHWFLSRNKELVFKRLEEAIDRYKKRMAVKI